MEAEKADLRQTGLSIKKTWQQLVEDWVQPERDFDKRLFGPEKGYATFWGLEDRAFTKTIEDITRFSTRLSAVEWPFNLDNSVDQTLQETAPGPVSGKKGTLFSEKSVETKNRVFQKPEQAFQSNKWNLDTSKPNETRSVSKEPKSLIEESVNPHQNLPQRLNGESENPGVVQGEMAEKSVLKNRFEESNQSPDEWFSGKNMVKPAEISYSTPIVEELEAKAGEPHSIPTEQNVKQHSLQLPDNQGGISKSLHKSFSGNEEINIKSDTLYSIPTETEPEAQNLGSTAFLPQVKNLQNLGSWLSENFLEEPVHHESVDKGTSSVSPLKIAGLEKEWVASDFFETESWENSPVGFFHPNDISPAPPPLISKQDPGIFESPFNLPGNSPNRPDAEDIIQELTEQLNREFKRFYGP